MTKTTDEELQERIEAGVAKILNKPQSRVLRSYYLQAGEAVTIDGGVASNVNSVPTAGGAYYVNKFGRPISIVIKGE